MCIDNTIYDHQMQISANIVRAHRKSKHRAHHRRRVSPACLQFLSCGCLVVSYS